MHHTFNPSLIVADSRRQVQKPNILLTVDCLFYEGKLLKCNRNNNSMTDIERVVGTPVSWITVKVCWSDYISSWQWNYFP